MASLESRKKSENADQPSPEQREMEERAEFFNNASEREGQGLKEFTKNVKTRLAVTAFVAVTLIFGQGLFKDAQAASVGGGSSSAVEDVWKKWSGEQKKMDQKWQKEMDDIENRNRQNAENARKKYEDAVEQMGKDLKDWAGKTSQEKNQAMEEKYENWNAYSRAYKSFHATRFNSSQEMAAGFLNVIGAFPRFRSENAAQRRIMDEDNFKRIVQIYVNKRNEVFPEQKIGFNRGLLELQTAFSQTIGQKEQKNYGFSLLKGGGKAN